MSRCRYIGIVLALGLLASAPAAQPRPAAEPILILVSFDAWRWDYIDTTPSPNLKALAAHGVRASELIPSFPSFTFPNHYTIVTGLYPAHHGIIANTMAEQGFPDRFTMSAATAKDGRWWGGEPIWVTAEKQGVHTAPYLWPGVEAPIGGVRPRWYVKFDNTATRAQRVEAVLRYLAIPGDTTPRFVTDYFSDADVAGHQYGPSSPQADSAITRVDSAVGALVDGIARLGLTDRVNVIVVADHGMTPLSRDRAIYLDDYLSMDSLDVIDWTPVADIAPKAGHGAYVFARLAGANAHLAVYRKGTLPARFVFNHNPHITPIVAIADEGWKITTHDRANRSPATAWGGDHGYDPQLQSMGAIFVAAGPAFRQGVVVPPFQNIHLYALMARILGITPVKTDGSLDSVRALLR